METLVVPQGRFDLERYPEPKRSTLRAWDAADEYVLEHIDSQVAARGNWVLVNDGFGALATAMAPVNPVVMSDSYLSLHGARDNLVRNAVAPDMVRLISVLDEPPERIDVLVVKIPKALALLEDQLHRLRPRLHPDTVVIGAGMARHVHSSNLDLFERLVGPTSTSLARKKARLIFARFDPSLSPGPNPYPSTYELPNGIVTVNHANVFSRRKLDLGTALLLEHLPTELGSKRIVDVGCGNGVVGLVIARANPDAELKLIDESFHAVASARETLAANGMAADVVAGDALEGEADASADLVVSNPPFHDDHALGDEAAWRIFVGAKRALRPGGELLIVGNRHLGYHVKLKRIFGGSRVVASNPKFVVLRAQLR